MIAEKRGSCVAIRLENLALLALQTRSSLQTIFFFWYFFKPFWGIFSYFEQSVDLFLWSWQCFLYWFKTDIRKTRENISSTFQCIRQEPILKGSCITPVCLLWKNIGETELPNTELQMAKIRVHNLFQQNGSKNKIYMFLNKFFI